jgi:hypothetical protein
MVAAPADRKAKRAALAREARRVAEEMEGLYIQLEQIGALATILQYMLNHSEGSQRLHAMPDSKKGFLGTQLGKA